MNSRSSGVGSALAAVPGCPFYAAGKKVSIDTPIGGEEDELTLGDTLADDAPSAESILMDKELLDALYDELNRLDPDGRRICMISSQMRQIGRASCRERV